MADERKPKMEALRERARALRMVNVAAMTGSEFRGHMEHVREAREALQLAIYADFEAEKNKGEE